jgi:putative CocE/NonD family hydrolase
VRRKLALALTLVLVPITYSATHAKAATTYEKSIVQNVFVTTRYGDKINIDLCLPSHDGKTVARGRFPVIAELSPYVPAGRSGCTPPTGCTGCGTLFSSAVTAGYVVAQVNSPGSGESDGGPWNMGDPGYALRQYDAIEWLGTQKWSTGKVGTIGGSGVGVSQLHTAPYRPPHLTTMIPMYSTGDSYLSLKPGGMRHATELLVCAIPGVEVTEQNGLYTPPSSKADLKNMYRIKKNQVENTQGKPYCPPLEGSWAHPVRDGYWDQITADLAKVTIPVWIWGSQDDLFALGTQDDWFTIGSKNKMLTFGFASHAGDKPGFDQSKEALRWFDYWLKGIDTGIKAELDHKRFRYNVFPDYIPKSAATYPIPNTQYTNFYLDNGSPSPLAAGGLSTAPPKAAGSASYFYTPTDGKGYNPFGAGETEDQRIEQGARVSFLGGQVAKDTEVTGPITMRLYAKTTSSDTDFVVKLLDIAPNNGSWTMVPTNGYLKGTFRSYKGDYRSQSDIPKGKVVAYDIQFYPTSWMFKKGHRIGIAIASGDVGEIYPNPNPAYVTVMHSAKYPSAIRLPIIPG